MTDTLARRITFGKFAESALLGSGVEVRHNSQMCKTLFIHCPTCYSIKSFLNVDCLRTCTINSTPPINTYMTENCDDCKNLLSTQVKETNSKIHKANFYFSSPEPKRRKH